QRVMNMTSAAKPPRLIARWSPPNGPCSQSGKPPRLAGTKVEARDAVPAAISRPEQARPASAQTPMTADQSFASGIGAALSRTATGEELLTAESRGLGVTTPLVHRQCRRHGPRVKEIPYGLPRGEQYANVWSRLEPLR